MLDPVDLKLISILQENATLTALELSDILHLSSSQIGRRKQRLEADGYIEGYHAKLSPKLLGLDVQAFVQVAMAGHTSANAKEFETLVARTPEVVSLWTLTGDADYMLRVFCKSLVALNTLVHDVFLPQEAVARVQTKIVMKQLQKDTGLPVL